MTRERVPVEPLSRSAWNRVEAGLFARLDSGEHVKARAEAGRSRLPRLRWAGAGVACAAAAAICLWWGFAELRHTAPETAASGTAAPENAASSTVAAVAPHETRILTTDAPTETTLGDAHVTLAAHSDVAVSGSGLEGWRVRLDAGSIDCAVAPRLGRPPFVVQGGETEVTVVGTRFTVRREGARSRVDVREGHVRVDSAGVHVLLSPGEGWPPAEGASRAAASAEAAAPGAAIDGGASDVPAAAQPLPSFQPRAAAVVPTQPPPSLARPESAQRRFERATRLEAKAPRAALAIYERLSRGTGPWAQNALYARARLELERGNLQHAEPLLRRYLRRYPQGLNTRDVEALLARIQKSEPTRRP
jgi:FecR-like protein